MKKKLLSGILAMVMAISVVVPISNVQAAAKVYKIGSVWDLNEFSRRVNSGNSYEGYVVKLTKDIVYDGSVNNFDSIGTTVGNMELIFKGTFDGAGHSVSNIECMGDGFFSRLGDGTVVKNLVLKNCSFTHPEGIYSRGTGGIVGDTVINNKVWEKVTIDNCHVVGGSVTASNYGDVGGILGYGRADIINCSNSALISGGAAAGIASYICNGMICNSYNTGDIQALDEEASGGLVSTGDNVVIKNCYNAGHASYGLAGYLEERSAIGNCYYVFENAYNNGIAINYPEVSIVEKDNQPFSASEMQSQTFLKLLNKNASTQPTWKSWKYQGTSSYPVLETKKKTQTITTKVSKKNYKASTLKNKKNTFNIKAKAKSRLVYRVTKGKKYLSVSSTGKVCLKKGTPKGTYEVAVIATGNAKIKKAVKKIVVKVK